MISIITNQSTNLLLMSLTLWTAFDLAGPVARYGSPGPDPTNGRARRCGLLPTRNEQNGQKLTRPLKRLVGVYHTEHLTYNTWLCMSSIVIMLGIALIHDIPAIPMSGVGEREGRN